MSDARCAMELNASQTSKKQSFVSGGVGIFTGDTAEFNWRPGAAKTLRIPVDRRFALCDDDDRRKFLKLKPVNVVECDAFMVVCVVTKVCPLFVSVLVATGTKLECESAIDVWLSCMVFMIEVCPRNFSDHSSEFECYNKSS